MLKAAMGGQRSEEHTAAETTELTTWTSETARPLHGRGRHSLAASKSTLLFTPTQGLAPCCETELEVEAKLIPRVLPKQCSFREYPNACFQKARAVPHKELIGMSSKSSKTTLKIFKSPRKPLALQILERGPSNISTTWLHSSCTTSPAGCSKARPADCPAQAIMCSKSPFLGTKPV